MQKSASRWQQPRVAVAKSPMATMASNSNSSSSSGSCSSSSFHLHNCSAGGLAASTLRRDQLLAMRKRRAAINVAHHSPVKSTTTAATRTAAAKRTIATGHAPSSNISSSYWEQRRKALTLASSRKQMLDADCPGFEPQNYLKERCKKCFRLREKHEGLSPLRHVPVERQPPAEDIVVLGPKAGAKRTQSIATTTTAAVRRVSVKKVAAAKEVEKKETDKDDEGKKNVAALRMVAVETETEEEEEEKPHEKQQKLTTRKEEEKQEERPAEERQQPPATKIAAAVKKSSTTTVLLPKQRQISLGGAKQPAATASNRESRNGWQFMSRQYASANGDNNSKKSAEQSAAQQNGAVATENSAVAVDSGGEEEDLQSLSSYRTANSRPANSKAEESSCGGGGGELHSAHSVDSLNSLSYAESFKTGKSPPFEEDDPFMTPTNTEAHFFLLDEAGNGGNDFDRAQTPTAGSQLEFSHLRLENQRLAEQCRCYRHERRRWTDWLKRRHGPTAAKEVDGQRLVEEALTELELMVSEYREENSALKSELDRVRDQDLSASAVTLNGPSVQQLEERARNAESACEQLRREREELQQEIDEMQDQYRVEEIEEFRELQRELEMNAKNCRILQFKLRKSERQREQLQAEKNLLAKKYQEVRRANGAGGGGAQSPLTAEDETLMTEEEEHSESSTDGGRRVAELEQELRVAKEISVKLHTELEQAEERRYRLEDELFYNKEKVRELLAQNKWREAKNSREQQQQSRAREVLSGSDSSDQEQQMMHREVRDSLEREADLREQLRFTEADLQRTRTRLRELELDNDELQQKYSRLAEQQQQQQYQNTGGGSGLLLLAVPKRPNPLFRSISEGSEAKSSKSEEVQQQKSKQQQPSAERGDYNGNMAAERKDTTVDAEQLCYMLAAMDAQANRICKQLEKLDGGGQSAGGSGGGGSSSKEEKRRSLKGDIVPVLEELGGLLAEMKAIKEQLAKSQNIALTKSMIVGNVLGDNLKEPAEGGNDSSCSECEDTGRRLDEFRDSCDFYKRKNAELTEQVLQMKDQWAKELRRLEEEADTKSGRMTRQMDELRAELEEQRLNAKVGDKALEECRAELAAMAKRLAEADAELDLARARAAGVDKGEEERTKWETRCKEMKADRIRLQAEVAQLKRRTDEAVNELEKMRTTHQHKEIAWIREKLKLEEQQKQQLERLMKEGIPPPTTLMGNGVVATGDGQQGGGSGEMKARIAELEKENVRLEKELQESRAQKQSQQEQSAQKQQQQQPLAILREAGRPLLLVEGTRSSAAASASSSRVDYKQIADNALKAAESLQRQYREYQRQYTMEVQRLNGQLGQLERELADRERRLRDQAAAGAAAAPPPPLPPSMQIRRAVESPSMSSLTENTTWDSRLLDCSMTRSISPFKFPRGNCPMMQCRTVDIHPTAAAAACAQQQQQQHEAAGPHFGSEEDMHREYRRTGSSGTNILYRIRREELSKGKHPSVRQMAKAFESFEKLNHNSKEAGGDNNNKKPKKSKSGGAKSPLFGLLSKASSTTDHSTVGAGHHGLPPGKQKRNGGGAKQQHRGSFGRATESPVPSEPSQPAASSTLPRGGRNPFKGMGSRIVDRVRRSLSRSKKSQSRDATPSLNLPEEPVAASSRWK